MKSGETVQAVLADIAKISDSRMQQVFRYYSIVQALRVRTFIGLILLLACASSALAISKTGRFGVMVAITSGAWIVAVFLTDKYVNKYPQRYFTYLIASHMKAAVIMAGFLWITGWLVGPVLAPPNALWTTYLFFVFLDALVSIPHRFRTSDQASFMVGPSDDAQAAVADPHSHGDTHDRPLVDKQAILRQIASTSDKRVLELIENNLPDIKEGRGNTIVSGDPSHRDDGNNPPSAGLLVSGIRINDARRLNRFFLACAQRILMGGYFVGRYVPHELVVRGLKDRFKGLLYRVAFILHFIWHRAFPKIPWLNGVYFFVTKGRNRVMSKVEVWGRLANCGFNVIAESVGDSETYFIAQRVAEPVKNKKPSYFPVVALEKVGLNGASIYTHKIRTMFPFSEFLQKRIFEDQGLASTGKFKDDYRLTEYGPFLRKYWLDELPQVFDWLRGEVKLFGMRATSRHYLSLYPKEVYDLYVQVKPGLIPPIFGESTNGLSSIAAVELAYLKSYLKQPIRTDIRYFVRTFTDIVFRGIRSK